MSDEKPKRIEPYPQKDKRSLPYHVARTTLDAGASLVPGAGYAIGELVRHYIGEPLEKRREEWFASLGEGVIELQERFEGFDPASLSQNEEFISTVYEATHLAMKTHRHEKREALKNAVLNAAVGNTIDDVVRGAFFAAVEKYSPLHVRLLSILSEPKNFKKFFEGSVTVSMNSKSGLLRRLVPATEVPNASFERVLQDLDADHMTNGTLQGSQSAHGLMSESLTPLGVMFLRFVSEPTS